MQWWNEHIVPRMADRACGVGPIHKLRKRVCAALQGEVVEIGFGSGHNVQHYPPAVTRISAIEPSDVGWKLSESRRSSSRLTIDRSGLDGQRLDEPDATYDCALSTFSLCTIPDVALALREVRRVLKPGGTFVFLEHGLSPDPGVRRWQARLNPLQKRFVGGCHLDRDIPALIEAAGFTLGEYTSSYLPGPSVSHAMGFVYAGSATG